MIKISALNEESSEESEEEDVPTITKEAQEQIALTEYNKALELLKQSKKEDALNIFKDLLETELLDQVEKPEFPDGRSRPMLSLKYSCFKNIGAIEAQLENYEAAIDSYWEAANLDDTDVTLWYRLGMLAMKTSNLEVACSSFRQGLKCNPNHWPCLDNIITALYAVPDYMNCLMYISIALERDSSYIKGLAFRDKIFKDIPYFEESYKLYNGNWELDPPLDIEYDRVIGDKLLAEAREVAEKWMEACRPEFTPKRLPDLTLNKPITKYMWLEFGESLIDMHKHITENNFNFVSRIKLLVHKQEEETMEVVASESNIEEDVDMDVDQLVDHIVNIKNAEEVKLEIENGDNQVFENSDNNECVGNNIDTEIETEIEDDKKSSSTDIQIIEDEDPLRILDMEIMQFEEQNNEKHAEFEEPHILETNEDLEKSEVNKVHEIINLDKFNETDAPNEQSNDKANDKSNDKVIINDKSSKMEDKLNEKVEKKDEGQKVKKRRRSSLCFLQQWAWSSSSMRRSARVRSSNRREVERDDVQLEETLRRIFPNTLLPDTVRITKDDPSKCMDDSMDTMDLYQLFANRENNGNMTEGTKSSESSKPSSPDVSVQQEKYFDTEQEKADVEAFINEHTCKSNLMIIIAKFTEFLCTKWNYEWPKGMSDIYLQAYMFTREHIPHPSPFGNDADNYIVKFNIEMTLLFGELHTDKWLDNKPDASPSSTVDKFYTGMPSEELGQIIFAAVRDDLLNDQYMHFLLRVLWLKANIFLCQGDIDIVIGTLELLLNHLKELRKDGEDVYIKLPNCKYNSFISIRVVEKKLLSIQRGQRLGQIQYLYDEKKYVELANILRDTFKFAREKHKLPLNNEVIIDRVDQLAMLLDSLWKLQQYEDCYVWAEACLNEAWQNYLNASDEGEQKKWIGSILNSLEKLDACVTEVSTFVVKYLPETRLSRLVQNLVHIVCHQLDVPENTVEMPFETVLPWILLHYILQYEEDKERAKAISSLKNKTHNLHSSESDDEDEDIPPSLMILFTAHEFIGRHSWCCINEAKLLFFTMNLVVPKLKTPQYASIKNKLTIYLEQVFFCLYGHPNKMSKSKPKHLEEHGVPQMKLTWEAAQLLFDFYKPHELPEFDSPKTISIGVETEILFKRISRLVPQESDPSQIADEMAAYIVGDREEMPTVKKPLQYQISSMYYLLGDFYFKNSKWSHAIRYYLLDLCLHPTRLNSWAGIAMATGTLMETWLNSCQTFKNENKFLAKAKIAQCSYQRAVELAPVHSLIWIEYGNFVYMVHSFCSRLLKQETDTLSMERFEVLETRKEDMLEIAAHCFLTANRIFLACQGIDDSAELQDERWLHHYMLAKIAEKKNEDPLVFLKHYTKASQLLYENNAHYPRRINYKNPQNLSIEALETHYRIHASILKYLEQHEGKPLKKSLGQLFQYHLKTCAEGPFMKYQSKLNDKKREDGSDSDSKNIVKEIDNVVEANTNVVTVQQRSNSIEEIEIIDKANEKIEAVKPMEQVKIENRKRSPEDVSCDNIKRIKLGSISHLQLMQDVVALIDDLITKVCDMVIPKNGTSEDVMVLSSDESNESKFPRVKTEAVEYVDKDTVQSKSKESKKSTTETIKSSNEHVDANAKEGNVQDLMDILMKRAMEVSQETQSLLDEDDTRKFDGKWLQNEDTHMHDKETKDKPEEKKKTHIDAVKGEVNLSRRGSQESTTTTQTTTTTETNNSSSSSSDDSSTSDDSSDSDTSSDSESESESDMERKKKEETLSEEEVATLIAYCLAGLEQCVLRFPEHYKSLYRLSHFFFNNKTAKDMTKCRNLLLGTYNCQFYPGQSFQGLFAERKGTNFFNGVWRIPTSEIDRPGSFASHMSRCITLLMQVLKETDDSRMLMELCVQLRKIPEPDKKYLRDSEREQLSRQALTLCLQSLRTRAQSMGPPCTTESLHLARTDTRTQVLLDVYKIYQQVQKYLQGKEPTLQTFASLLIDTYKSYTGNKNMEGNILEIAVKYCQQQILANKIATTNNISSTSVQTPIVTSSPVTTSQATTISTSPQISQSRKPYKASNLTGRPRGRPPNVNKYFQAMQQSGNLVNQFNPKSSFSNYLGSPGNRALMNPYFMNPLIDPNMLSAMLATGLGNNMIDPLSTISYLSYQDILRQYQNNLSTMTNLASGLSNASSTIPNISTVPTLSTATTNINTPNNFGHVNNLCNLGGLTVQQLLSLNNSTASAVRSTPTYQQSTPKMTTITSTTNERPNISITPVGNLLPPKTKVSRHDSHSDSLLVHGTKPAHISQIAKPISQPPTTQVSLLKPSVIQQVKIIPPKQMAAPQIRVSKSLTEPQPAHNSSLSHSPLKNSNSSSQTTVPQVAHTAMGTTLNLKPPIPINLPSSRSGTSLQHKLLSKKHSQRMQVPSTVQNPPKKQRSKVIPIMSNNFQSLINTMSGSSAMSQTSFVPPELSGISVGTVASTVPKLQGIKLSGYRKTAVKLKSTSIDIASSLPNPLSQTNSVEALSMLSQLQQHSHLEIIPQQKVQPKQSVDYSKNVSSSLNVTTPKLLETLRPTNPDCLTAYELSKGKAGNVSGNACKRTEKPAKDSVEIITLDD